MRVEISGQLGLFLASLICGCVLSVFYDLIRMGRMSAGVIYGGIRLPQRTELRLPLLCERPLRKVSKAKARTVAVIVFLGDVLFFAVAAAAMLCVFFNYGGGKVRGIGIFLAAVGFLACHYTVGALVIRVFAVIKLGVQIAAEYLFFLLMLPVRKILLPVWRKIAGAVYGCAKQLVLRLYTKKQERKMLASLCGFKSDGGIT